MGEHATREVIVPHGTVLPPPTPGERHVSVVWLGVVIADDDLRRRVDQFFHWPMIVLALLVLPLLALELTMQLDRWSLLWWMSAIGLTVIWLAFLVEFVVKISIAECRIDYVKRNWLDLVILLIPVLRPLRAGYIVRTSRVFTLRGVGMKFARYFITFVIGMEATERLLERIGIMQRRDRKEPKEMTRQGLIDEVNRLRALADQWELWHAAHREHVERHGGPASLDEPPSSQDEPPPSLDEKTPSPAETTPASPAPSAPSAPSASSASSASSATVGSELPAVNDRPAAIS